VKEEEEHCNKHGQLQAATLADVSQGHGGVYSYFESRRVRRSTRLFSSASVFLKEYIAGEL